MLLQIPQCGMLYLTEKFIFQKTIIIILNHIFEYLLIATPVQ
jgi:hypothetical protein